MSTYNLKEAFDDLKRSMKECDLPSFIYKCKNLRITEDGDKILYNLDGKNCSFKVYPSDEIGFKYKIVLKVDNGERIMHTDKDYLPTYVWENGRCYVKHSGILESALRLSTYRD